MAWVKVVCGRLKSDCRYSIRVVYNNFPIPDLKSEQKESLNITAQKILDVRQMNGYDTLETLYRVPMKKDLLDAHRANDKAVMDIYTQWGITKHMTDSEIAQVLLKKS